MVNSSSAYPWDVIPNGIPNTSQPILNTPFTYIREPKLNDLTVAEALGALVIALVKSFLENKKDSHNKAS